MSKTKHKPYTQMTAAELAAATADRVALGLDR